jgi:hypothetical protein
MINSQANGLANLVYQTFFCCWHLSGVQCFSYLHKKSEAAKEHGYWISSHSRGLRFVSRPGNRFYSVSMKKNARNALKQATTASLHIPHPFDFLIHQSSYYSTLCNCVFKRASVNKIRNTACLRDNQSINQSVSPVEVFCAATPCSVTFRRTLPPPSSLHPDDVPVVGWQSLVRFQCLSFRNSPEASVLKPAVDPRRGRWKKLHEELHNLYSLRDDDIIIIIIVVVIISAIRSVVEMDKACNMNGRDEKCTQNFGQKTWK